jgi:hypothetical protein
MKPTRWTRLTAITARLQHCGYTDRVGRGSWVLLIGLAGCGDDVTVVKSAPHGDVGVEGGIRLRPVMVVADDAAGFLQWYDSVLDVRCSFSPMADGSTRCLPTMHGVGFTDPACTQAAWVETPCTAGPRYGGLQFRPASPHCGDPAQAYPRPYVRAEASSAATSVYSAYLTPDGLVCEDDPVPLAPGETLVLAQPIPYETFVAAAEHVVAGHGRLGRVEWRADDGARELIGPYDGALDQPCRRKPLFADGDRCVVRTASVHSTLFADAGCTEHAAYALCDERIALQQDECAASLFELGEPVDEPYGDSDGTCAQIAASDAHRIGVEIGAADLPQIGHATVGGGRLQARIDVDTSGWQVAPSISSFFDTELNTWCSMFYSPEHCVPFGFPHDHYADPACTEPLFVMSASSCGQVRWASTRSYDQATCMSQTTLFEVLDPVASAVLYTETDAGDCVEATLDAGDVAYQLGPPRTPDSFPEVRIETW